MHPSDLGPYDPLALPDTAPGERPTIATACGKVILLGEHSVVYGEPALAAPLSPLRLSVVLAPGEDGVRIELDDGAPEGASTSVSRALAAAAAELDLGLPLPLRVAVRTGGLRSGMGTSAALGVALGRALLLWHGEEPDDARVLAAAEAVERLFHGNPSGVDHTVSALEAPLWFRKGETPDPLTGLPALHFALLRRGSAASTAEIVAGVRERLGADSALVRTVARMGRVAEDGLEAWERGDVAAFGEAMTAQQAALDGLGVVAPSDRDGIDVALGAGAVAAKITGAGMGGSLLALAEDAVGAGRVVDAWGAGALAFAVGDPG